jgi:hypothetical protein
MKLDDFFLGIYIGLLGGMLLVGVVVRIIEGQPIF